MAVTEFVSSPARVIRVRERRTLCQPDISQLIMRACRVVGFPSPAANLAELVRDIASDRQGLFIGFDDDRPCVTACGFLPADAFWLAASVGFAYSEKAPRQLVARTWSGIREWFQACGHDHVIVANFAHTDRSYIRGLKTFGMGEKVGSLIKFSFGGVTTNVSVSRVVGERAAS